jgi:hypothetical protein
MAWNPPTERERRHTIVGWPETGGLWVSDFEVDKKVWIRYMDDGEDPPAYGFQEVMGFDQDGKDYGGKVSILGDRFDGTFYSKVEEYKGLELMNSFREYQGYLLITIGLILGDKHKRRHWWNDYRELFIL